MRAPCLCLTLALTLATPLAAQETPATLIKQLESDELATRLKAVAALRKLGEAARESLENYVHPVVKAVVAPKLTPELKRQIDELIAQLDARRFKAREEASAKLLEIGKPATEQLRAATKSESPEVSSRCKAILGQLYPAPKEDKAGASPAVMEAAMLLGHLGNRKSIPALRHLLRDDKSSGTLVECAAFALRDITGGGPPTTVLEWGKQRAAMLAKWEAHLKRAQPAGEPVELALKYVEGTKISSAEETLFIAQLKMPKNADMPAGFGGDMKFVGKVTSTYELTVTSAAPFGVSRLYREHEQSMKTTGGPGMAAPGGPRPGASWKGKTLALSFDEAGRAKATLGGGPIQSGDMKGPLSLGHTVAMLLPAGKYAVGQRKQLSAATLRKLASMIFITSAGRGKKELLDASGSARYVGRVDGVDRYFLTLKTVMPEASRAMNMNLQGIVEIDVEKGVMKKHALSGLLWQKMQMGAAKGSMAGEMHFRTTPAPEKK